MNLQVLKSCATKLPKPLILLFTALTYHPIWSQDGEFNNNNLAQTIPPSPTAAALGEYGSYPVSGSSGLPSIQIPLIDIHGREITLPVSLSYHGDGVKVDEIASWVGMGWSLNAGGVITRNVVGYPDEDEKGLFGLYTQGFSPFNPENGYGLGWDMLSRLSSGLQKGEPDIYTYNFLGYSGQFIIDHNEDFHHYNQTDLAFERRISQGDIIDFKITIGDGTTLIFDAIETLHVEAGGQGNYEAEIAWYLTRIIKGNDQFDLIYESETINEGYACSEIGSRAITNGGSACLGTVDWEVIQGSIITKTQQRLKAIAGPYGTMSFNEGATERKDLSGTNKLASITYLDQTIQFRSEYTEGTLKPSINCTSISGPGSGIKERLFLNEVEFIAGDDRKKYILEYLNPNALPPTKSFDQDHWGYYNDANNYTLLPSIDGFDTGGDRSANSESMLFGTLKRITYPTGGYSDFEWEPNRSCETSNQTVEVCNTLVDFETESSFQSGGIEEFEFTLEQVSQVNFTIDVGNLFENTTEPGAIIVTLSSSNESHSYSQSLEGTHTVEIGELTAGTYSIKLENHLPSIESVTFSLQECHDEIKSVTNCQYYGGLRIKSIENFSAIDHLFNKKCYQYGELSSSRIVTNNSYTKEIKAECTAGGVQSIVYSGIKRHDRSLLQFSNNVTYESITEKLNDNSKIVYDYYELNDNWGGNSYEAVLLQDHSWKRNLLKQKTLYNNLGLPVSSTQNHYTFVPRKQYEGIKVDLILWNRLNGGNNDHQYAKGLIKINSGWARLDSTIHIDYHPNGPLVKKNEFEYFHPFDRVAPNLIRSTDSDGQLTTSITLYPRSYTSEGLIWDRLREKYFYLPIEKVILKDDKIASASVFEYGMNGKMISLRKIAPSELIPKSDFTYSHLSYPAGKGNYLPSVLYDSRNEIDLMYDGHNLVNKLNRNGQSTAYVWGYAQKYPVAKIENYSSDELRSLIGSIKVTQILHSSDNTYLETELKSIMSQLPSKAQMTIYLYKVGTGLIKIIDPNRNQITYQYDDFGRLKSVFDNNGNLLSKHTYQYSLETK